MSSEDRILAIVGPTAIGKTDLAIRIAIEADGEIVNTDSRQVYRYMDIGTAKPVSYTHLRAPRDATLSRLPSSA